MESILEEAFAVVREAAWRVLELRHYDVQVLQLSDKKHTVFPSRFVYFGGGGGGRGA